MRQEVLFLLCCMFATTCCGVFYTTSDDNDYPRMGKRSFFTSSKENTYPRMGRSGDFGKLGAHYSKRRFTAGGESSYPRIGRSRFFTKTGDENYPRLGRASDGLAVDDSDDFLPDTVDDIHRSKAIPHSFNLQAPIAFLIWDKNGDGQLSKSEFLTGLSKSRHRSHKK